MKTRSCRLAMTITVDGVSKVYDVKPVRSAPAQAAQAFRLTKRREEGGPYDVVMSMEGKITCSCPGWASAGHCRHVDALSALGILCPEPFMRVRRLGLELEGMARDLEELRRQYRSTITFLTSRVAGTCFGVETPTSTPEAEPTPATVPEPDAATVTAAEDGPEPVPARPKRTRKPRKPKPAADPAAEANGQEADGQQSQDAA
jgi:hypothetical protein